MMKGKQIMVLSLGCLLLMGGCGLEMTETNKSVGDTSSKKEIIGVHIASADREPFYCLF